MCFRLPEQKSVVSFANVFIHVRLSMRTYDPDSVTSCEQVCRGFKYLIQVSELYCDLIQASMFAAVREENIIIYLNKSR